MSRKLEALLARREALIAKSDAHRNEMVAAIDTWRGTFGWLGRLAPAVRVITTVFGILSKFR